MGIILGSFTPIRPVRYRLCMFDLTIYDEYLIDRKTCIYNGTTKDQNAFKGHSSTLAQYIMIIKIFVTLTLFTILTPTKGLRSKR